MSWHVPDVKGEPPGQSRAELSSVWLCVWLARARVCVLCCVVCSSLGFVLRCALTPSGVSPGPCNMHTADFVPEKRSVYLFRGGNGVQYLNELHALNVGTSPSAGLRTAPRMRRRVLAQR